MNNKPVVTKATPTTNQKMAGIYQYGRKKAKQLKLKRADLAKMIADYRNK